MKKLMLALLFAFMASSIHAQYRTYKKLYDVKEYKYQLTDRYNPRGVAVISFFFPGMGHVLIGKPIRGLAFNLLNTYSLGISLVGLSELNDNGNQDLGNILAIGGVALWVASRIWCMADVKRVAKIKNMHFREQNLSLHFYPSLQRYTSKNALGSSAPGATLSINF